MDCSQGRSSWAGAAPDGIFPGKDNRVSLVLPESVKVAVGSDFLRLARNVELGNRFLIRIQELHHPPTDAAAILAPCCAHACKKRGFCKSAAILGACWIQEPHQW